MCWRETSKLSNRRWRERRTPRDKRGGCYWHAWSESILSKCTPNRYHNFYLRFCRFSLGTVLDYLRLHILLDIISQSIQISLLWKSKVWKCLIFFRRWKFMFSLSTCWIDNNFLLKGQVTIEFYVDRDSNFIVFHSKNLTITEKVSENHAEILHLISFHYFLWFNFHLNYLFRWFKIVRVTG